MPRRGSLRERRFNRSARRRFQPKTESLFQTYLTNMFGEWLTLNSILGGTVLYSAVYTCMTMKSAPRSKTIDWLMIFIISVPYGVALSTTSLIVWNMLMETVDSLLNLLLVSTDVLLPKVPHFLRGVLKLMLDFVLALVMMIHCVLQLVLLSRPNQNVHEADLLNAVNDIEDDSDESESPRRFQPSRRRKNSSKYNKSSRKQKGKSLAKATKQHDKESFMSKESGSFWHIGEQTSENEMLSYLKKLEDCASRAENEKFGENMENLKLKAENQLYKNRLDVERDRLLCTVCHEEDRKLAIVPCMHFFLCKACWEKLSLIDKKCPYCDRTAEDVTEIFVP
uniref:RING-type domain-containing protein n=1 Tax=Branchiostoma floridae TaxID=7739 RepID=C3ZJG2_BRAFL|eukprot:XP_002591293.1 hypothetical protein BRAFLDRAFT_76737 [Branchiostoma floridae]